MNFVMAYGLFLSERKRNVLTYPFRAAARVCWSKVRIVIASIPRCGSTILLRSLADLPSGSEFPRSPDCVFVRDLAYIPNCRFIKTHSLAPMALPEDVKVIFLFGDPVAAIKSTLWKRWDQNHFRNCGFAESRDPEVINMDELGYEAIFDSWTTPKKYPILAVRCEKMKENESAIQDFIGAYVTIPRWRQRNAYHIEPSNMTKIQETYMRLNAKVENMSDLQRIS